MNKVLQFLVIVVTLLLILTVVAIWFYGNSPFSSSGLLFFSILIGVGIEWYVYLRFWAGDNLSNPSVQRLRMVLFLVGIGSLISLAYLYFSFLIYVTALLLLFRNQIGHFPPKEISLLLGGLIFLRQIIAPVIEVFLDLLQITLDSEMPLILAQNGLIVFVSIILHYHLGLLGRPYEINPREAVLYKQVK